MRSKTILIVDNDKGKQKQYKDILEANFHKVVTCENGFDAVLKYIEFSPEITIMEFELPKMNGCKTVWQIKEFDPNAVIIFLVKQIKINAEYLEIQTRYNIPVYLKSIGVKNILEIIEQYGK